MVGLVVFAGEVFKRNSHTAFLDCFGAGAY